MISDPSIDEVLRKLGCQRKLESYDWVLGTAVNGALDGETRCLVARLRLGDGSPPAPRETIAYPQIELWEGLIPVEDAVEALRTPESHALVVGRALGSTAGRLWNGQSPTDFWPAYLPFPPCYFVTTQFLHDPQQDLAQLWIMMMKLAESSPVAEFKGPDFVDFRSATRSWLDWSTTPKDNDSRFGAIEVMLPLPPGHVRSLRIRADDRLALELEPGLSQEELSVRLAWDDGYKHHTVQARHEHDGLVFDDVPEDKFTVYVFHQGTLLTHFRAFPNAIKREARITEEHDLLDIVRHGESETVEFKEVSARDLTTKGDRFWNKLLRVIASFANTDGGTVLLGVRDDAKVLGVDEQVRRLDEVALDGHASGIAAVLPEQVRDHLTRKPRIDARWAVLQGHSVFVIRVARNEPGVVTGHPEGVIVRRGSTSRVADAGDCERLFGARSGISF